MVAIPDERLDRLSAMSASKQTVRATFQIAWLPALSTEAGKGLGSRLLGSLATATRCCSWSRAGSGHDPTAELAALEEELILADLGSVEARLDQAAPRREGRRDARARDRGARAGGVGAERRRAAVPLDRVGRAAGAARARVPAHEQAGAGRREHRRRPAGRGGWPRRAVRRRGARGVRRAGGGPGRDRRGRRGARPVARRPRRDRERGAPPRPPGPGPPGPVDVPHHRGEGVPRLDLPRPARRRRSAPASSTPICSAASSGPRSSTGRRSSPSGRGRERRSSASSGSRARTTSSPTATSSRSGSTCERGRAHCAVSTGRLVLVGTPIGNLADLTPRAVEALRTADLIAAEDTRRTRALLTHAGVAAGGRLVAVHEHNERRPSGRARRRDPAGPHRRARHGCGDAGDRRPRPSPGAGVRRRRPARGGRAGAERGGRRARGLGPARRPVRLRGLPAPQGPGRAASASRRSRASRAPPCASSHPTGWPRRSAIS